MNSFILVARLTKDPELKHGSNGKAICKISVAVQRDYKGADGKYQSDFFNLTAFEKKAEIIASYLRKGSKALFDCTVQNNNYEKEGKTVYNNEFYIQKLEFLDTAKKVEKTEEGQADLDETFPF
jgi:single-strand DNA-binding protein